MDFRKFVGLIAYLKSENRLLKFAIIVVAVSNVFFGLLSYRAAQMKQIVVVPLTPSKSFVVGPDPDAFYITQVARFVIDNLLTYTPYTVKKQYENVLPLFDSSVFYAYKKVFESFVSDAIQAKLSSVFFINEISYEPRLHIIRISGKKITIFQNSVVDKSYDTYELKYKVKYGQFTILSYKKLKKEK